MRVQCLLLALLWSLPSFATPPLCSAVVGDEDLWSEHQRRRRQALASVTDTSSTVVITHHRAFAEPEILLTQDVQITDIVPGQGAWLTLGDAFEGRCGDQAFVRQDDALGGDWQVAHVGLDGLLLLRRDDDQLAWLPSGHAAPPAFELIWQSSFRLVAAEQPTAKKRKKKRRQKKRRSRRRR